MKIQTFRNIKLEQELPSLSVENFNSKMTKYLSDPACQIEIKKDWKRFIISHFTLTENQVSFFGNLPVRSTITIQKAFASIIESGGTILLEKNIDLDAIEVVCNGILIFKPTRKIVICRFDGFFKNCKWFPKDQKHEDRPGG